MLSSENDTEKVILLKNNLPIDELPIEFSLRMPGPVIKYEVLEPPKP